MYDPQEHEPLCDDAWDERAVHDLVRRTIEQTDAAFDHQKWWPIHPEDVYDDDLRPQHGIYSGAAGTMWGLHELSRSARIPLNNDYAAAIVSCDSSYRTPSEAKDAVPGYFIGTTGILAARYAITEDALTLHALRDEIQRNLGNVTREVFWGSSGSALAALLIRESTGDSRFDDILREIQNEYWASWPEDGECPLLWMQQMYGKNQRYVGAGHGAFGNLAPFIRAPDLLTAVMRTQLHGRIVKLLETYALHDGDATNWISCAEPRIGNRLQWCHGAPGIIMALAPYPSDDPRIEDLLRRGGEAIWQAGPLKKGPNFCHGTAGNGYALLRLYQRSGNTVWLRRAQRVAMHAIRQIDIWRNQFGVPSFSLWTGEIGVALFANSVLRRDAAVLALDTAGKAIVQ